MSVKVLIACEESQAVCIEFRKLGFEAFSCDILDCSGGHPEWHIKGDAIKEAYSGKYKIMIGFPECTHLAVSGAAWFEKKIKDGRQQEGIDFFMKLINAPIKYIAIENPIGVMSTKYKKPDQIINPYYFGDTEPKKTCLWLKNLPSLFHAKYKDLFNDIITHIEPEFVEYNSKKTKSGKSKYGKITGCNPSTNNPDNAKLRSKTYPGIAKAMADQWSKLL